MSLSGGCVFKRFSSLLILIAFVTTSVVGPRSAYAQNLALPAPGQMLSASAATVPVLMKGLKIHPENPVLFDFILDTGKSGLAPDSAEFRAESEKLIKYFLASLTIKEDDLWVNLSPFEKDRMIASELGMTAMGRDMLAQDYILKQLTASLIYPERELGRTFWDRVYAEAQAKFGTTDIPLDTFNKVWIVADKAKVYEKIDTRVTSDQGPVASDPEELVTNHSPRTTRAPVVAAFVVGAHLRVMLETDYLAQSKEAEKRVASGQGPVASDPEELATNHSPLTTQDISKQILREVVIPAIEKEVNEGTNFATLRQMYQAMILASWYKRTLKDALLNQVYTDQGKIGGVQTDDPTEKDQIYQQYLAAYKVGVFNYIKEETDSATGEVVPRKYFSGGLQLDAAQVMERESRLAPGESLNPDGAMVAVTVRTDKANTAGMNPDAAMNSKAGDQAKPARPAAVTAMIGDMEVIDLGATDSSRFGPVGLPVGKAFLTVQGNVDGTMRKTGEDSWVAAFSRWRTGSIQKTLVYLGTGKEPPVRIFKAICQKVDALDNSADGMGPLDPEIQQAVRQAIEQLRRDGAIIDAARLSGPRLEGEASSSRERDDRAMSAGGIWDLVKQNWKQTHFAARWLALPTFLAALVLVPRGFNELKAEADQEAAHQAGLKSLAEQLAHPSPEFKNMLARRPYFEIYQVAANGFYMAGTPEDKKAALSGLQRVVVKIDDMLARLGDSPQDLDQVLHMSLFKARALALLVSGEEPGNCGEYVRALEAVRGRFETILKGLKLDDDSRLGFTVMARQIDVMTAVAHLKIASAFPEQIPAAVTEARGVERQIVAYIDSLGQNIDNQSQANLLRGLVELRTAVLEKVPLKELGDWSLGLVQDVYVSPLKAAVDGFKKHSEPDSKRIYAQSVWWLRKGIETMPSLDSPQEKVTQALQQALKAANEFLKRDDVVALIGPPEKPDPAMKLSPIDRIDIMRAMAFSLQYDFPLQARLRTMADRLQSSIEEANAEKAQANVDAVENEFFQLLKASKEQRHEFVFKRKTSRGKLPYFLLIEREADVSGQMKIMVAYTTDWAGGAMPHGFNAVSGVMDRNRFQALLADLETNKRNLEQFEKTFSTLLEEIDTDAAMSDKKTVLVVGNSYLDRLWLDTILERAGFNVVLVEDSQQALEIVQADPGRFQLVVSDVVFPRLSGPELVSEIYKLNPKLPVIIRSETDVTLETIRAANPNISSVFKVPQFNTDEQSLLEQVKAQALDKAQAPPGGIDLNAKKLDLEVDKSGGTARIQFDRALIEEFKKGDFTGLTPVIINITPIANPAAVLGFGAGSEEPEKVGYTGQSLGGQRQNNFSITLQPAMRAGFRPRGSTQTIAQKPVAERVRHQTFS